MKRPRRLRDALAALDARGFAVVRRATLDVLTDATGVGPAVRNYAADGDAFRDPPLWLDGVVTLDQFTGVTSPFEVIGCVAIDVVTVAGPANVAPHGTVTTGGTAGTGDGPGVAWTLTVEPPPDYGEAERVAADIDDLHVAMSTAVLNLADSDPRHALPDGAGTRCALCEAEIASEVMLPAQHVSSCAWILARNVRDDIEGE